MWLEKFHLPFLQFIKICQVQTFFFFFKGVGLFIYLFLVVLGLGFCARAFSSCGERGPLTIAASLVVEHRLQTRRLSSCGSRAQLLRGMWDLPRPGLEPVSPALVGRFLTTAPPGKPQTFKIGEDFVRRWVHTRSQESLWLIHTLFSGGKYFKTLKSFSLLYEDFSFLALFIFWFVHQNLLPGKIHTCLFMDLTDSHIIFTECQACSRFSTNINSVNPYYDTLKSVLLSSLFYGYVHRSPRPLKFKQVRDP